MSLRGKRNLEATKSASTTRTVVSSITDPRPTLRYRLWLLPQAKAWKGATEATRHHHAVLEFVTDPTEEHGSIGLSQEVQLKRVRRWRGLISLRFLLTIEMREMRANEEVPYASDNTFTSEREAE